MSGKFQIRRWRTGWRMWEVTYPDGTGVLTFTFPEAVAAFIEASENVAVGERP